MRVFPFLLRLLSDLHACFRLDFGFISPATDRNSLRITAASLVQCFNHSVRSVWSHKVCFLGSKKKNCLVTANYEQHFN